ncbi:hypothetical protein [Nocardia sp. NPDC020380]
MSARSPEEVQELLAELTNAELMAEVQRRMALAEEREDDGEAAE